MEPPGVVNVILSRLEPTYEGLKPGAPLVAPATSP